LFLSGERTHPYTSPSNLIESLIVFETRPTKYNLLFSFVPTYIIFLASSISIPVGESRYGHFGPSLMLSFKARVSFTIAYFNIQLSFPPEAYRNFSSLLNFIPYHDFGMILLCRTLLFTASINCNDCTLWPLLVTAINFFDGETAIFKGRSP